MADPRDPMAGQRDSMADRVSPPISVRVLRVMGFLLVLSAEVYLIVVLGPSFRFFNHFGYFTVLSNVLAAVVFAIGVLRPVPPVIRGAAVVYMVTTGIVYAVLLRGVDVQTPAYANVVLHVVMPLVVALEWLLDPPPAGPVVARLLPWLVIPVVYVVYTLVRGPFVDWYPYPFLDPRGDGGYGRVAATGVGVAVTIVVLAWLVAWTGNLSRAAIERAAH